MVCDYSKMNRKDRVAEPDAMKRTMNITPISTNKKQQAILIQWNLYKDQFS